MISRIETPTIHSALDTYHCFVEDGRHNRSLLANAIIQLLASLKVVSPNQTSHLADSVRGDTSDPTLSTWEVYKLEKKMQETGLHHSEATQVAVDALIGECIRLIRLN